ncbi:hypothetical protein MW887_005556 [Aspergillus wentii]|nr:hypothetical protein MW887_005556 [Aspergillus wentii]
MGAESNLQLLPNVPEDMSIASTEINQRSGCAIVPKKNEEIVNFATVNLHMIFDSGYVLHLRLIVEPKPGDSISTSTQKANIPRALRPPVVRAACPQPQVGCVDPAPSLQGGRATSIAGFDFETTADNKNPAGTDDPVPAVDGGDDGEGSDGGIADHTEGTVPTNELVLPDVGTGRLNKQPITVREDAATKQLTYNELTVVVYQPWSVRAKFVKYLSHRGHQTRSASTFETLVPAIPAHPTRVLLEAIGTPPAHSLEIGQHLSRSGLELAEHAGNVEHPEEAEDLRKRTNYYLCQINILMNRLLSLTLAPGMHIDWEIPVEKITAQSTSRAGEKLFIFARHGKRNVLYWSLYAQLLDSWGSQRLRESEVDYREPAGWQPSLLSMAISTLPDPLSTVLLLSGDTSNSTDTITVLSLWKHNCPAHDNSGFSVNSSDVDITYKPGIPQSASLAVVPPES